MKALIIVSLFETKAYHTTTVTVNLRGTEQKHFGSNETHFAEPACMLVHSAIDLKTH